MNINKLNKLKPIDLNCNVFDVYNYEGLSMQELLCQFFTKINECINTSNEVSDLALWLVNEGLEEEVVNKLMLWLNDGTLENLINTNIFNSLHNKIENISSKINIKYPPSHLKACVMDGITDDSVALQNIIDYAETIGRGVKIHIPKGKMVVNQTILLDFSLVQLDCAGEIISYMDTGTILRERQRTPENIWKVYEQGGLVVNGLKIVGSGINNNITGIKLATTNDNNIGSSRIKFSNCSIKSCGVGIELGSRAYANTFENCSIYDCAIDIKVTSGFDCGERISINECTLFNSGVGLLVDNPNATVYVNNTSIDYCSERLIEVRRGNVFVNTSHIEFDAKFYTNTEKAPFKVMKDACSTLNIDNSFIMCGRPDENTLPAHIFDVDSNPYQGMTVSNCTLQGFKCSGDIVKNNGVVRFINNNMKEWDVMSQTICERNNLLVDPHCHNLSPSFHNHIMVTNNDNLVIHRGDGEWSGSNCWKVEKKSGTQTLGEVVLYAPYNGINKIINGRVEIESNVACSLDIAYQGIRRGRDGVTLHYTDLNRVGQISVNANERKILQPNYRQGAIDKSEGGAFEYIAITIGLFNAPPCMIKFKNYHLYTL